MKPMARWKLVGLLLLVFAAGGVCGGLVTHYSMKRALAATFDFERWPDRAVRFLDQRLGLSTEQEVEVRAIQERLAERMKQIFRASLTESGETLLSAGREIDEILTPDQRVIHAELKDELRAGFRRHFNLELPAEPPSPEPD